MALTSPVSLRVRPLRGPCLLQLSAFVHRGHRREWAPRKPLPGLGDGTETIFYSRRAHRTLASLPNSILVHEKCLLSTRTAPRSTPAPGTCSWRRRRLWELGGKVGARTGRGQGASGLPSPPPPGQLQPGGASFLSLSGEDQGTRGETKLCPGQEDGSRLGGSRREGRHEAWEGHMVPGPQPSSEGRSATGTRPRGGRWSGLTMLNWATVLSTAHSPSLRVAVPGIPTGATGHSPLQATLGSGTEELAPSSSQPFCATSGQPCTPPPPSPTARAPRHTWALGGSGQGNLPFHARLVAAWLGRCSSRLIYSRAPRAHTLQYAPPACLPLGLFNPWLYLSPGAVGIMARPEIASKTFT